MRSINSRFTYLLTYLLTRPRNVAALSCKSWTFKYTTTVHA